MARILIVEDSPDNMLLFQSVLRLAGHEVDGLTDGAALLDRLEAGLPDVLLLDIQLPDRDGFSLLAEVRAQRRFGALRVVALTAHAMAGDEDRALEAGFDGYITKPIKVREFAAQVERFVAG